MHPTSPVGRGEPGPQQGAVVRGAPANPPPRDIAAQQIKASRGKELPGGLKWVGIAVMGVRVVAAAPVVVPATATIIGLWGATIPLAIIGMLVCAAASKLTGQGRRPDTPLGWVSEKLFRWCLLPVVTYCCIKKHLFTSNQQPLSY